MKTGKLLAALMVVAMTLSVPCLMAAQTAPDDVVQAAVDGLQPYLQKIPADAMDQYGFAGVADLASASLGTPFLVHVLTPAALEKYKDGMTVAEVISPTTMWYFPVLIAGQPRAILVVDKLDNKWQAVSLGYAGLAGKLGAVNRQWPASKGFNPVLIVVFQAKQYLFSVPEKDAFNLTSLSTGQASSAGPVAAAQPAEQDYVALGTAGAVIGGLKSVVQQALSGSK